MEIEIKTKEDREYYDRLENFLIDFDWNNEKPRIFMRCCFNNKVDFLKPTLDFICSLRGFGGWKLAYLLEYYAKKNIIIHGSLEYIDNFYKTEAQKHKLATAKKCREFPKFEQYLVDCYNADTQNIFTK
jgi:hypothetical protein